MHKFLKNEQNPNLLPFPVDICELFFYSKTHTKNTIFTILYHPSNIMKICEKCTQIYNGLKHLFE